ncbi:hypothetical protein ASD24_29615 [Paenibacillus sp. Root52]|uniref:hypothetical protein n=1 Tax=Paenibacillus sp. Root52 TaxID=1736552 RepID=UPI0006FCF8E0|nr:hypothetical protein [Paenibacillus sp. Root52]KQY83676.1 hypothetical protein ASD24_29615 [Paenibacillus sp. Root52]
MYTSKELIAMINKQRETQIQTYVTHYKSSYKLDKSDSNDIAEIVRYALDGKTDEAIRLFEELETYSREILANIINKQHQSNMLLAINRISHIEIEGDLYEIDYGKRKVPEVGDLIVGRSDFRYDWQSMSLVIQYGRVIEVWESGLGITKDGGFDRSLFMDEAFVLNKVNKA